MFALLIYTIISTQTITVEQSNFEKGEPTEILLGNPAPKYNTMKF